MAEGTLTETIRKIVAKAEPYVPQVPKPKKKIPLQTKIQMKHLFLLEIRT